jgi:hypothetical protein
MADHPWCRLCVVTPDGTIARIWILDGPGRPDVAVVDDVARLALGALRRSERLVLRDVAPLAAELFRLAALPVETDGEAERGEQALGIDHVQEEGHLGDLPS